MTDSSSPGAAGVSRGQWTPDSVAAFWDYQGHKTPPGGYFSEVLSEGLLRLARWQGVLGRSSRVLDYGCGRGPLIEALLKHGVAAGGLEFSTESAELTNSRFQSNTNYLGTRTADVEQGWPDDSFDLVYCVEVVEHLLDEWLDSTFESIERLLRPGGAVVITTPFDEDLNAHQVFCPFCRTEFHHMQHVRSWTVSSLSDKLASVGLDVTLCRPLKLSRFCFGQPAGRKDQLLASWRELVIRSLDTVSGPMAFRYAASVAGPNLVAIARKP